MQSTMKAMPDDPQKLSEIGEFNYHLKDSWPEYNLHTYDMSFNGVATNTQAIFYQGRLVRFAGKNYHVFPNESLLTVIDPIMEKFEARRVGAPDKGGFELVYGQNKAEKFESNYAYQHGEKKYLGTKIRANYVFDKFDVTGEGDITELGVSFANSIGGDMALQVAPYSLRQVCSNGMMHNASIVEISDRLLQSLRRKNPELDTGVINSEIESMFASAKDLDEVMHNLKQNKMIHNKEIPVNWITSRVFLVRESIKDIKKLYRDMTKLFVSQNQAERLAHTMPKRLLEKMEWLNVVDSIQVSGGVEKMVKEVTILGKPTKWQAFNDITEDLTHVERAFDSKAHSYRMLDQILVRGQ